MIIRNFQSKTKFLFIILACLLFLTCNDCLIAQSAVNSKNFEIIKQSDIVVIKVPSEAPESIEKQRNSSYLLLKPFLKRNIDKISVIWQSDEYSYGKIISISNIYIRDYLNKKISLNKFQNYFQIKDIEPIPFNRNIISKIPINEVSYDLIIKGTKLREKADLYRLSEKYDSAIRIYNQALQANPNDNIALFWLAEIYRLQKNYEFAKAYYTKALGIDPEFKAADDALYDLKKLENN